MKVTTQIHKDLSLKDGRMLLFVNTLFNVLKALLDETERALFRDNTGHRLSFRGQRDSRKVWLSFFDETIISRPAVGMPLST